jgi:RND family efflux transporter MFP subunit
VHHAAAAIALKQTCAFLLLLLAVDCKRSAAPAADAAAAVVKIGANDFVVARTQPITTGPVISGTLAAATDANVRAEVPGPVLDVRVQEGERVQKGQLLARIGAGAISAQQSSQSTAISSLRNNLALAQRELDRQQSLFRAGIAAKAQVDVSRQQVDAARAQLAQAQGQIATTNVQASNTTVEAPLSGVVTKRWVSEGDVVQVGATLYTIIDPQTMQLEAGVAADSLQDIRVGTPIEFTIQGIDGKTFVGRIARVNPEADPATRQIKVFAEIPNANGALASGLFAQGRIRSVTGVGVIAPSAAIDRRMTTPAVTRVRSGVVEHVTIVLGVIDDQNDRVEIRQGVNAGDVLLVGAAQQIAPGTHVELPAAAQQAGDAAQ